MRCHYEVFELDKTASAEEIKKQYKKLALRYHPDRNHGREEEAAELFKEVSTAYGVLSNPQERRWYDDHREAILRGGKGGGDDNDDEEGVQQVPNLWPYFNSGCFKGFGDDGKGFYYVYRNLFQELETLERSTGDINLELMPGFGNQDSPASDVLRFYTFWSNFVSQLSFSWEDKYNPSDAPDRAVRRAIEKENKTFRDAARKSYNDLVRNLAGHVRIQDPRIEAIMTQAKEKKEQEEAKRLNARKEEKERKRQLRERNRLLQKDEPEGGEDNGLTSQRAFRLADDEEDTEIHMSSAAYNDVSLATEDGAVDTEAVASETVEEEDTEEILYCEICDKSFKSEAQLAQHIGSKVHRKKEQELSKMKKKDSGKGGAKTKIAQSSPAAASNSTRSTQAGDKVSEVVEDASDVEEDNTEEVLPTISSQSRKKDGRSQAVAASDDDDSNGEEDSEKPVVSSESIIVDIVEHDGDFGCEICSKWFKSEAQLTQHITSKVHRKREQELAKASKKETGKKLKTESSASTSSVDKKLASAVGKMNIK